MNLLPLQQMCDPDKDFAEYLLDWEFVEAVTCSYADVTGFLVLGLLVWGAISSAIFIRTNSLLIPFGLLLMTGGAVLAQVASVALPFAVLLVLVLPASVTAFLYYKYGR